MNGKTRVYYILSSFMGLLQSLPFTPYIKMVDLWLLCMILYPFLMVILLSVKESLDKSKSEIKPSGSSSGWHRDDHWSLKGINILRDWGLMLILLLFIVLYWIAGILNFFQPNIRSVC